MRLFVAVNPPTILRQQLAKRIAPLHRISGIRAVAGDAVHITMSFLGHVEEARVPEVHDAVAQAAGASRPFTLRISGTGAFPNVRRPRVWWVGVEPSTALARLHEDLATRLAGAGFKAEERPFEPHLTVARVRDQTPRTAVSQMLDVATTFEFDGTFEVRTLDLMRSELRRDGPRYTVITAAPLAEGS